MENFRRYGSIWHFLRKNPKNLWSVIIIWIMAITCGIVTYTDRAYMSASACIFVISFLVLIMMLGVLRVKLIYDRAK